MRLVGFVRFLLFGVIWVNVGLLLPVYDGRMIYARQTP